MLDYNDKLDLARVLGGLLRLSLMRIKSDDDRKYIAQLLIRDLRGLYDDWDDDFGDDE